MDLILPDLGLLFWTALVFCILLFLLAKFAWKPILSAVNAREQKITEALELAEKTRSEMQALQAENDNILKEAKESANQMIEAAKSKSKSEADKIVENARHTINSEKAAAMAELKTHVAALSLEIAEKVIRGELASDDKQKALADKLVGEINMN